MKKIILIMIIAMFGLALFADSNQRDFNSFGSEISEIKDVLQQIEDSYISSLGFWERRSAISKVDKIFKLLEDLEPYGNNQQLREENNALKEQVSVQEAKIAELEARLAALSSAGDGMTEADFSQLLIQLKKRGNFDDDRIAILNTVLPYKRVSVRQAAIVLAEFDHDDNRFAALEIMLVKISDRSNAYILINSFSFSRYKEKAQELLASGSAGTSDAYILSNQDFQLFYRPLMENGMNDRKRITHVQNSLPFPMLTLEQTVRVLESFDSDEQRFVALRILYPKLAEKQHKYSILPVFDSAFRREAAKEYMEAL
jgi:hypothetical protein